MLDLVPTLCGEDAVGVAIVSVRPHILSRTAGGSGRRLLFMQTDL